MNSPAATKAPTKLACIICEDEILPGERHAVVCAEFGEGEHAACTAQWFRTNYGREGLA